MIPYNRNSQGLKNCRKYWDFSGHVPVAKKAIRCPNCRSKKTIPRQYRFHSKPESQSRFRCVIGYKCTNCSRLIHGEQITKHWGHGVVIPEEMFMKYFPDYKDGDRVAISLLPQEINI